MNLDPDKPRSPPPAMLAAPKARRRWPKYSLRSLLVLVTVAAVIAWYLRPSGIKIIGDISSADVAAICEALSQAGYSEPVLLIELLSPSCVEVHTGVVRGPLSGGGKIIKLDKQNDTWMISDVTGWVS